MSVEHKPDFALRDRIRRLLNKHPQPIFNGKGEASCPCGWKAPVDASNRMTNQNRFRAHVAYEIETALTADALDRTNIVHGLHQENR